MSDDVPAVRVHLTGSDVPLAQAPAPRRRLVIVMKTLSLTAQTPVGLVGGRDLTRKYVLVQSITQDVVLCSSKSNAVAGEGAILPHANTVPTRIDGVSEIWAYAATVPAQVSVIECTYAPQERA